MVTPTGQCDCNTYLPRNFYEPHPINLHLRADTATPH